MSKFKRQDLKYVSWQEALKKPWKVYEPNEAGRRTEIYNCEDMSIITADGEEVVGCSEWMRADREVFDHVVELHNQWLATQQSDPAA